MKSKILAKGACALSLASLMTVGGLTSGASAASSSSPYRIYALESLSGPLSVGGKGELLGLQAAVKVFNAKGGIDGHKIVFTYADDQFNPTNAVTLIDQQVNSSTPPNMVVGGTDGSITDAIAPILTAHKILSLEPTARLTASNPKVAPYDFASVHSAEEANTNEVQQIANLHKYKNIAILAGNDTLGTQEVPPWQNALKANGIKYETVLYNDSQTNFTPEIEQLEADHPDALLLEGSAATGAAVVASKSAAGWFLPTYVDVSYSGRNTQALNPPADSKNTFTLVDAGQACGSPAEKAPEFTTFWNALLKVGGSLKNIGQYEVSEPAFAFDAIAGAYMGAQAAHSTSTVAIAHALETISPKATPYNVMYHPEAFNASDHTEKVPSSNQVLEPITDPLTDGFTGLKAGGNPRSCL
jgi:branched-chain amino acid transport system substrate-binding protein